MACRHHRVRHLEQILRRGGPAGHNTDADDCADLHKGGRSTLPLFSSNMCGIALWAVHILLRLDHNSPHKSHFEASYTLWRKPPQFYCPYLHNQQVLISLK